MPEVFFSLGATELSGEAAIASREAVRKKPLVPTDNNTHFHADANFLWLTSAVRAYFRNTANPFLPTWSKICNGHASCLRFLNHCSHVQACEFLQLIHLRNNAKYCSTERKSSKTPVKVMMIFVVFADVVPQFLAEESSISQSFWRFIYHMLQMQTWIGEVWKIQPSPGSRTETI